MRADDVAAHRFHQRLGASLPTKTIVFWQP
jgi:hypothetical protein